MVLKRFFDFSEHYDKFRNSLPTPRENAPGDKTG